MDILGLTDGASWDEINAAYKDLVRVWHPDRFQTDERLRKRAEEQTRLLNSAIEALRKNYKERKARATKREPPRAPPQRPPEQPRAPEPDPMWQQTFGTAAPNTTFVPAPFVVYQRFSSSLRRIAFSAALGALGFWLLLLSAKPSREQAAFGCIVSVFAIHSFIRNILVLATHSPLIVIDRRGVSTLESGIIGWSELARIWTVTQARTYCLSIRFSDAYLSRQPLPWRLLLKLRNYVRHTHLTIPGSGFDVHPNDVIRAIDLRQLSGDVEPNLKPDSLLPTWVHVVRFVALSTAAIPVIRMLLKFPVTELESLIYLGTFALCQVAAFVGTPVKPPKR